MSNRITAYFRGRVGVTEAVYQNDYGIVMNFDDIDLPAHFDCYFSTPGEDEAVPAIGADNMVQIPNAILARSGRAELHIPLHTGANDSEVEYIVHFKVIGRARPVDDGTPVQMTAIEQALALLQNPIGNMEQIVNEALAFTGDTFAEMQAQLDADQAAFKTEVRGDIADVESDFDNLNAQFQTAVSAVTVDSEVQNVRVGADNVTYASAGEAVRTQFTNLKSELNEYVNGVNKTFTISESGQQPALLVTLLKGIKYSLTNNTSGAISVGYRNNDGTDEEISGMQPPVGGTVGTGQTVTFTPTKDTYVGLSMWTASTGEVIVKNDYSNLEVSSTAYSKAVLFVENGEIVFKNGLIANKYITTNGDEANYNGWSCTDYIELGDSYTELIISSPASNGGNYDSFYDENKTSIAPPFALETGENRITVPDGAKYVRLSNTTEALNNTTIKNIIGYLMDAVENLQPETVTPSIASMNIDESMVTNAGANYGSHSGGQSNVQKRFSMLVTTDPHGDATAMERSVEYLNDMPCFDCGVCLGDLQADTFTDNDGTWYTNAIKDSSKPWLTLIGNHDVGIGKSIASTGNQEQVYNKFIAPNLQYAGVTPDGKSYYYKDFATYKIRLICLNAYDVDNNDTSGSEYNVPRYTEYYSQAQIDWFVSLLANTPSDYHVMILTHNTPKASTKDTSVNFNNKTYSFSPESSQQGIVADIVDAWQRGTTLSHTYTCTDANLDSVTVSADFTSRGAGVLICFLTGHMHVDAIGHITSFTNQNVFTFASTNTGTWQNDWSDLPRADGTKAEDCITAIAVDTTNRDIYINRIGSSVSRWFTVREPSVISY